MDLPRDLVDRILAHFGHLAGLRLRSVQDLQQMGACDLLRLTSILPDRVLPLFVGLLKGVEGDLFQKLLGEHDEELRELSNRFFSRYQDLVLEPQGVDFNPLEVHLPDEVLADLPLLASRQAFFLRQRIEHVNRWMERYGLGPYPADAQEQAWNDLWAFVVRQP